MQDALGVQGQQRRPVWLEQRGGRKEGGMKKQKRVGDEVRDKSPEGGRL